MKIQRKMRFLICILIFFPIIGCSLEPFYAHLHPDAVHKGYVEFYPLYIDVAEGIDKTPTTLKIDIYELSSKKRVVASCHRGVTSDGRETPYPRMSMIPGTYRFMAKIQPDFRNPITEETEFEAEIIEDMITRVRILLQIIDTKITKISYKEIETTYKIKLNTVIEPPIDFYKPKSFRIIF